MKKSNSWKNTWGTIEFYRNGDSELDKIQNLLDNGADINARNEKGDTPLISAIREDNIKCAEKLLENNPDVHIRGDKGNTALHWAAYRGSAEIVEKLLQRGARTNVLDEFDYTPLYWAVSCSQIKIVRMLVEAGVEYDDLKKALDCTEQNQNCSLTEDIREILLCGLDEHYEGNKRTDFDDMFLGTGLKRIDVDGSIKTEEPATVEENIIDEETVVEEPAPVVNEPAPVAQEENPAPTVPVAEENTVEQEIEVPVTERKPLVLNNPEPVNETPEQVIEEPEEEQVVEQPKIAKKGFFAGLKKKWFFSWRKIKWSKLSEIEAFEKVQRIIDAGAKINISDGYGETPLMFATKYNNPEIAKMLILNGADVNMCDKYGNTALHKAAKYDVPNMAKILVVNGVNVNATDRYGRTALHWAAEDGYFWIVKELAEAPNTELNMTDEDGNTALMLAVFEENTDIVDTLIKYGADVNVKNNEGKTIFNYLNSAVREDRDMLRVIRDARKDRELFLQFEREREEKERLALLNNIITAEGERQVLDLLNNDRGAVRAQIVALQSLLRQTTPQRAEMAEKLKLIYDHGDRRREYARMKQQERVLAKVRDLCR